MINIDKKGKILNQFGHIIGIDACQKRKSGEFSFISSHMKRLNNKSVKIRP